MRWWQRLLFRRRQERQLDDELRFHFDLQVAEHIRAGMSEDEARRRARLEFGGIEQVKDDCRDARRTVWLETAAQDSHFALRSLLKTPAFTAVAVASLALGIGANTALFSLMNNMLLRSLPVRDPGALVEFARHHPEGATMTNLPFAVYSYLRRNRGAADVFALTSASPVLRAGAAPEKGNTQLVSGSFFSALGVNALLGRTIGADDDHPFTIIGIMPPDFVGVDRSRIPDLWFPFAGRDPEVWVLARLKPGVTIPQAQAALEPLFREALESLNDDFRLSPERERGALMAQKLLIHSAANGTAALRWSYWEYSPTLKILLALTGLILLIACANLANLLMARSVARSRELAIRLAIGAGRWRLVRQLLNESLLLALAGGALGLLVAVWGHRLLLSFLVRSPETTALDFRLDARVLGFSLAMAVLTALLFGLVPAIRATRVDLAGSIQAESRRTGAANVPLARVMLALQVGLSLVLLIGAGLFARSLRNLGAADLGISRENLLLMDIRPAGKTSQECQQFWLRLDYGVSRLPGVRSTALAGNAVFGRGMWNQTIWLPRPGQAPLDASVDMNPVSPGFFATVGIPVLIGREFGAQDAENAPPVALVNQTFARRFYGNENPIGKRFGRHGAASAERYEIVGVVGDAKYRTVRDRIRPMAIYPLGQAPPRGTLVLHVRTAGDPASTASSIRREILAADPDALITDVRSLPQVVRTELRQDRMFAALAGSFALLALTLGAIGIYGVLAYRVTQRTAEIGLRIALGAQRGDVLWLIMRETLVILAAGTLLGVPAALAATRLIKSVLFGLEPSDPLTIGCALATLFAAGALAGFLPARRAAAVEPVVALRNE